MRYLLAALLLIVAPAVPAQNASESSDVQNALNNLAHEFAICSAYFLLVSNAPRIKDDEPNTAEAYGNQAERLIWYSAQLTTNEQAFARQDLAFKDMMRMMDNDWSKISIVMNEYLHPCKDLAEKPQKRLQELVREPDSLLTE